MISVADYLLFTQKVNSAHLSISLALCHIALEEFRFDGVPCCRLDLKEVTLTHHVEGDYNWYNNGRATAHSYEKYEQVIWKDS